MFDWLRSFRPQGTAVPSRRKKPRYRPGRGRKALSLASAVEKLEDRTLLSGNPFIAGDYEMGGLNARVEQSGDTLTFINENGGTSAGVFVNESRVEATDWGNLRGNIVNGTIEWDNGSLWNVVKYDAPDIAGSYLSNGQSTAIQQNGVDLLFVNEFGANSSGRFLSVMQVEATDFGITGLLDAQGNISWSDGSQWTVDNGVPNIAGDYTYNGQQTRVEQNGQSLTFINENGDSSTGRFLDNNTVEATQWGQLVGSLLNGDIVWSNGATWTADSQPNFPDIAGDYTYNGQPTRVEQNGQSLTFINENGDGSTGRFLDNSTVEATQWGQLIGSLDNGNIVWSNGATWFADSQPNFPDIAGDYFYNGQQTRVEQSGSNLTFINEQGNSSSGRFLDNNTVEATQWGQLVGSLLNGDIVWSNGATWTANDATSPQLTQITSSVGFPIEDGQIRIQAPAELRFEFDSGSSIDPATLSGISIIRSVDGVFGNGDDAVVAPAFLGLSQPNVARFLFAEVLPDDTYRITVNGAGPNAVRSAQGQPVNDGVNVVRTFELTAGSQVVSVDPQPLTIVDNVLLQDNRNQINVSFSGSELDPVSAETPEFYELVDTKGTVDPSDDTVTLPQTVTYNPTTNQATLLFENIPAGDYIIRVGAELAGSGAPDSYSPPNDDNSSFGTAAVINDLGDNGVLISSQIESAGVTPAAPTGQTVFYNFESSYGTDAQGNTLYNLISESQKERTREIFEVFSFYLGFDAVETADQGITIAAGDLRAIDFALNDGPGGIVSGSDGDLNGRVILDAGEAFDNTQEGSWFQAALAEVNTLLQSSGFNTSAADPFLNGQHDLSLLRRAEADDVDIYTFSIYEPGELDAGIFAQQQGSSLDSVLTLYAADGTQLAQNDNANGDDSAFEIDLPAGNYFIAVTSTGTTYDPNAENTGSGASTTGLYDLRLNFTPETATFNQTDGTPYDADVDGNPGGVFEFSFRAYEGIGGEYEFNGESVFVRQLGSSLTFVNENGSVSAGRFRGFAEVEATTWGDLSGFLTENGIEWSNGTVWQTAALDNQGGGGGGGGGQGAGAGQGQGQFVQGPPQLIQVIPNVGDPLLNGNVRDVAPNELLLQFDQGQAIDPNTLADGIVLVRAGLDGQFDTPDDVEIVPGFIGIGDEPNEVIVRFAESLPNDNYRLTILGTGATPLTNIFGTLFGDGVDLVREFELDLGAQILAVNPQSVLRDQLVTVSDASLVSDGDTISVTIGSATKVFELEDTSVGDGLNDPANVQVDFDSTTDSETDIAAAIQAAIDADADLAGGAAVAGAEVTITGDSFAPTVVVSATNAGAFVAGEGGLQQRKNEIVVYFNEDTLDPTIAELETLYQLIDTKGTLDQADDEIFEPDNVTYDAGNNTAVLRFDSGRFAGGIPEGSYRLRVGVLDQPTNDVEVVDANAENWRLSYTSFLPGVPYGGPPQGPNGKPLPLSVGGSVNTAAALILGNEQEGPAASGANNASADAEFIVGFGTGDGDDNSADISGNIAPLPAPIAIGPFVETHLAGDDGSITLANPTNLLSGQAVIVEGTIGDGPFGSPFQGLGDFDFFEIENVQTGDVISVDIDTPVAFGDLDSSIAIWDAAGNLMAYNDDQDSFQSLDSYLQFLAPAAGNYYVSIHGFSPFGDLPFDPFDSSSGGGFGSEGAYTATIGLNSNDIDYYSVELEAGDIFGANVLGAGQQLNLFAPNPQTALYSIDVATDSLVLINPANGDVSTIGAIGFDFNQSDMTFFNGSIFAVTSDSPNQNSFPNWFLVEIDPQTGALINSVEISVTTPGTDPRVVEALTTRDGALVISFDGNTIAEVDPTTGIATPLFDFGLAHDLDALSVHPSDGTLYAIDSQQVGGNFRQNVFKRLEENPFVATNEGIVAGNNFDFSDFTTLNNQFIALSFANDTLFFVDPDDPANVQMTIDLGVEGLNLIGLTTGPSFDQIPGIELIGSSQDITGIHPTVSPLPGGGNAALSYVAPVAGTYTVAVSGHDQSGAYDLQARVFRPDLELQPVGNEQIIFLDFDGATVDASIFGGQGISELSGIDEFLDDWKLDSADPVTALALRNAVIDHIIAEFTEVIYTDIAANGNNGSRDGSGIDGEFDVTILNSRDHDDPFGQTNVSRVIIGGSIAELGIQTIGIAQSVDVGNFETEESAVVLLDLLSAPFGDPNSLNSVELDVAPEVDPSSMIDLVGIGVGRIAAHEAGHFFGAWHTDQFNATNVIMDQGGNLPGLLGLGPDGVFNTADDFDVTFGPPDTFVANEGFTGTSDALNALAFGLSTGTSDFDDNNSSFDTASFLGGLDDREIVVNSRIQLQNIALPPLPGGTDEPGQREIAAEIERHINSFGTDPAVPDAISTFTYNFRDVYGVDLQGNDLFNAIEDDQKDRVREIFELYGYYLGFEAVETADQGLTIAYGDMRAVVPDIPPLHPIPADPGDDFSGVAGVNAFGQQLVVLDKSEENTIFTQGSVYGGPWFTTAMHLIGDALGLGHSFDVPSIQGDGLIDEPVFPGDHDLVHLRRLFRPDASDIDLYEFEIDALFAPEGGTFTAEIMAERLADVSLLNSALTLFDADGNVLARNDDYYSNDSFIEFSVDAPGTYFIGVTSTGNLDYDPQVSDTGSGGRTDGDYELRLNFRRTPIASLDPAVTEILVDATGTAFDGDADGKPGGAFEFWFEANTDDNTIFVDKVAGGAADGSLSDPFTHIDRAIAAANIANNNADPTDDIGLIRIIGNGGADNDLGTAADVTPYLIINDGDPTFDSDDGPTFIVPQGVTVMIDQGVVIKLEDQAIDVGSAPIGLDRSGAALQVLGTPDNHVTLTSNFNETIGGDTDESPTNSAAPGDWGGIVYRGDSDMEDEGIFLNIVNLADITFGGGSPSNFGISDSVNPVHVFDARPRISYNTITQTAGAALSANPNSFDDYILNNRDITLSRIGPDVVGNMLTDNSLNGLKIRIETLFGEPIEKLDVSARFDDTDVIHIFTENLAIAGNPGGPMLDGGTLDARESGRLRIDPNIVVKLGAARIEAERGNANFFAEGNTGEEVIFTSIFDDTFGRGGTFDSTDNGLNRDAAAGDWGGIVLNATSGGSIDNAYFGHGGGLVPIEGAVDTFNVIEIHQADVRISNSRFESNAAGITTGDRNGRGTNDATTIFVRGAQPVVTNNEFIQNQGSLLSINVNALNSDIVRDLGRSTGGIDVITDELTGELLFSDNHGPLIAGNVTRDNARNALDVRAETLTTESTWDDADIVHVVTGEIIVPNFHTFTGLRLESSTTESLVVKFDGEDSGITAAGNGLDIDDRIGGIVQIVGQPLRPVVLTSLRDNTVGAGFRLDGQPQLDTDNVGGTRGTLPTGPEVDNGTLIDNDVDPSIVGHFEAQPVDGGEIGSFVGGGASGVTAQGRTQLFTSNDFIFDFLNFVDVGGDGQAVSLASTTIDSPATRVSDDTVVSTGNFAGENDTINWSAETRFDDGIATLFNTITFTSDSPLGNLQFINYLDEDVLGASGDVLQLVGTPGESDFRAFTINQAEGIGFSQGGVYEAGDDLQNATYDGFAADVFSELRDIITGAGTTYSVPGNIDLTDLPPIVDPFLGDVFGPTDVTTAFSWTVDPATNTATITTFLELIAEAENPAQPGDWRSVQLQEFSHDRNVIVTNELESVLHQGEDLNKIPLRAQFLGDLAPDVQSGDENRRLGFTVDGSIAQDNRADLDVYSFNAEPGTEVWIDIDRTDPTLDAVVELVDANGTVLALASDNYTMTGLAQSLFKDGDLGGDYYTSNPNDAGFRVVLPGNTNLPPQTYFVRVRSWDTRGNAFLEGETNGNYQLQIRLQQRDEIAGSNIRSADIRFATNGIEVFGLPGHSPLITETVEVGEADDTITGTTQDVGNLLGSDRNSIGIGGVLESNGFANNDVDFYTFTIDYEDVQGWGDPDGFGITRLGPASRTFPVTFDIDYADGLARADSTIAVFDSNGTLIYLGRESNVEDDQPEPGEGADLDDISRGSVGKLDPFIGTIHLPAGNTRGATSERYFVAVSSNSQLPVQLNATFTGAGAANPLIRLEPVNSIQRIAEDHIGTQGHFADGVPVAPRTQLLDIQDSISIDSHVTPFVLQDVVLFTSNGNNLNTVDPQFGHFETDVGTIREGATARAISDMDMRSDGRLFGISGNRLLEISSAGTTGPNTPATLVGTTNIQNIPAIPTGIDQRRLQIAIREFTTTQNIPALTYERVNTGNYNLYYAVNQVARAADQSLTDTPLTFQKLYRANAANGSAANTGAFGFQGFILDDVEMADDSVFLVDTNNPARFGTLYIQSLVPGVRGNDIVLNLTTEGDLPNQVTVDTSGPSVVINVRLDVNAAPTLGQLVTLLNTNAQSRQYIVAGIAGNGTVAGDPNTNTIQGLNLALRRGSLTAPANIGDTTISITDGQAVGLNPGDVISVDAEKMLVLGVNTANNPDLIQVQRGFEGSTQAFHNTGSFVFELNTSRPVTLTTEGGEGDPTFDRLVQGMSYVDFFGGAEIHGVTDTGEIIRFRDTNRFNVDLAPRNHDMDFVVLSDVTGELGPISFVGSSLGPQNLFDSAYRNFIFANATDGRLIAFDAGGNLQNIFGVETGIGTYRGFLEVEPNDTDPAAQDLEQLQFLLHFDANITDESGVNISQALPHLTIQGTGNNTVDVYSFEGSAGARAVFDIDSGDGRGLGDFDSFLTLRDSNGNVVATDDDLFFTVDSGSATDTDALLDIVLPSDDTYFLEVSSFEGGSAIPVGADYLLHVSIEGHLLGVGELPIVDFGSSGAPRIQIGGGSATTLIENDDDAGAGLLSRISRELPAGNYAVVVGKFNSFANGTNTDVVGQEPEAGDTYSLNISIEDKALGVDPGPFSEVEPNNSFGTAQDVNGLDFTTLVDPTFGALPNVTIDGTGDGTFDYYTFTVDTPNTRIVLETAAGNFDTELFLFAINEAGLGANFVQTDDVGASGLAFSPLDFNLWHPTELRGNDAGHGVNPAPDNTRGSTELITTNTDDARTNSQASGNVSFYFGFEEHTDTPDLSNRYLQYESEDAQLGVLFEAFQQDLASNAVIGDNVNLPGGAIGSLTTNSFDLSGYDPTDRPTLYFNYFLDTENTDALFGFMRDSARVMVSSDGGQTFFALASNNSIRSTGLGTEELPSYFTHTSSANTNPALDAGIERVQELYDDTGGWRQARIDLSDFAGEDDLMLRFDFSTAGTFDDAVQPRELNLPGDVNGNFFSDERGQNNTGQGFFIDDIIIGFAERGEMVTAAQANSSAFGGTPPTTNPLAGNEFLAGPYQLEIRRGTEYARSISVVSNQASIFQTFDTNDRMVATEGRIGDDNLIREQGQLIINGNQIRDVSEYGIFVDAGTRDAVGDLAHQGSARVLPTLNQQNLATSVYIQNNVISNFGTGGIFVGGDTAAGPEAVLPFAKIVNNTIYGGQTPSGTGIDVGPNASPTMINNIVANTNVSIDIDPSSTPAATGTAFGFNVFQNNGSDPNTVPQDIQLFPLAPLFVDPANLNFYLAQGSLAVDSSLNRLQERPGFSDVKDPLGIPPSDIFAPAVDIFGQFREDDPGTSPPPGLGSDVFKDRGAIERNDTLGPEAQLIVPLDNGPNDNNTNPTEVAITSNFPTDFVIQLIDVGIGINDSKVESGQFVLTRSGTVLVDGIDYLFIYDPNTDQVTFRSTTGPWELGQYTINVDNSNATGVVDNAENALQPNRADGTTAFSIRLGTIISVDPDPNGPGGPGGNGGPGAANDRAIPEGDAGFTDITYTVSLSEASSDIITVDIETSDGTATILDNDYVELPTQTLTFNPGETEKSFIIRIVGDINLEPDETFFVTLSNPSDNAGLGDATSTITILNDDPPQIEVNQETAQIEGDIGAANFMVFTVSLSDPTTEPLTVDYTTRNGSAIGGIDYTPRSGTLVFSVSGATTQNVLVPILGDFLDEGNEDFFLDLSNATNGNIVQGTGRGEIIDEATDSQSPLQAVSIGNNDAAPALQQAQLDQVLQVALAQWEQHSAGAIGDVTVGIANLSGNQLGAAYGSTVLIDVNAAGNGWFIDQTADANEEYTFDSATGQYFAQPGAAASGVDLLTVLLHELGHVAGLDDIDAASNAGDIMAHTLDRGVRRGLDIGNVATDGAFAAPIAAPTGPTQYEEVEFTIGNRNNGLNSVVGQTYEDILNAATSLTMTSDRTDTHSPAGLWNDRELWAEREVEQYHPSLDDLWSNPNALDELLSGI